MEKPWIKLMLLLAGLLTLPGGAQRSCDLPPQLTEEIALEDLDASLFLIGDAGEPGPTERSLFDLERQLEARSRTLPSGHTFALFLGDNVYPDGLREFDPEGEHRLQRQLDVFQPDAPDLEVRGGFLAGNHDWRGGSKDPGRARVCRQGEYLRQHGGGRVSLLPKDGCPGPESVLVGTKLAIVNLDTEWLRRNTRGRGIPENGDAGCRTTRDCPSQTSGDVYESLAEAVREHAEEERLVVVAGHHPLVSGGCHGQGAMLHRRIAQPFVTTDLSSPRYRRMIRRLHKAMAGIVPKPLLHAAGHEHGLQLINFQGGRDFPYEPGFRYQVVSGSGSLSKLERVQCVKKGKTLFGQPTPGFMRLDVSRSGRAVLTVWNSETSQVAASYELQK